LTSPIENITPI